MLGAVNLSLRDVLNALVGEDAGVSTQIVWNLRLPRALVGGLVGPNLAVAGVLLQAVMRNALAVPNTIGVTAGAGLAATFILVLIPGWPSYLPACAFVGALAATVLVYGISWMPGVGTSPVRMVLAGVAVTSILGAVTTFIMLMYNDRVGSVILWQSGSLNARSWQHLSILWPYSLVGLVGAVLLIRSPTAKPGERMLGFHLPNWPGRAGKQPRESKLA
jgi:iron complex transport system permease protein